MNTKLYHVRYFLFGLLYYLIIPIVIVSSQKWEDAPGMDLIYNYYKDGYYHNYLFIVISLAVFFILGSLLPYKFKSKIVSNSQSSFNIKKIFVVLLPLLFFSQYVVYQNRGHLFQGYTLDFETDFVGTICTTNMLVLFLFLYNKIGQNNPKYNKYLKWFLIILIVEIISFGTRMYAMISFVALITYYHQNRVLTTRKLLFVGLLVVFFILVVGIWRSGGDFIIDVDSLAFIAFGEPLFTWISAISLFDLNKLPLFAFPYEFLSSFINFLPTVLFPNKSEYIIQSALRFDNPLGARSILCTLISNFGIFGSFVAIFCLGFYLSYVRLHWKSVFGQTYYICVCGILPFLFFRESCSLVNKTIFYNFLILPALLILVQSILFPPRKRSIVLNPGE